MNNIFCRFMLFALLATTASSCGLYSKYKSETVVEDSVMGAEVASQLVDDKMEESQMFGNLGWKEIFTDAKLQGLIRQALSGNRDLQIALNGIEQAEISLRTKRLAYLPQIGSASGGYSVSFAQSFGSYDTSTAGVSASWVLDVFGSLRNDKMRQKMLVEQSEYTVQAVHAQVVMSVAELYYSLQMLNTQIEITSLTEQSWSESLRVAKAMMEAGMMNKAGVAQIEAAYYGVKSALHELTISQNQIQNAMCGLIGIEPQTIEVAPSTPFVAPEVIKTGVAATTLAQRPDVRVAEAALAASFYSENLARSNLYPKFSFSYAGGLQAFDYINPAKWLSVVAASVIQPIFNSGLNRATLQIAKITFESTKLQFEQTLLNAGIEVNDAMKSMAEYEGQSEILNKQVETLTEAAKSTELLMSGGGVTYLDVLSANQSLYSAQISQAANQYNQYASLITLYAALGGGRE